MTTIITSTIFEYVNATASELPNTTIDTVNATEEYFLPENMTTTTVVMDNLKLNDSHMDESKEYSNETMVDNGRFDLPIKIEVPTAFLDEHLPILPPLILQEGSNVDRLFHEMTPTMP